MKSYKNVTTIVLVLILLVAIIFAIFHFSNSIFKVKNEAKLVEMSLPPETQNLITGIEVVRLQKGHGQDSLFMSGWVLQQKVTEKKRDVYMVLRSGKSTLVFEIGNASMVRPDVTKYYHLDGEINTGFEMSFPLSLLKENKYQVGFIIEDKTGKYFAMSQKALSIAPGAVVLTDFTAAPGPGTKSNVVSLTLKEPTGTIKYHLEAIEQSDKIIKINGWGFIQGMNADDQKSYLLLKKNDKVTVFSMGVQIRKDVTSYFKASKVNLDSAGFTTQVSTENLEKGHYLVGLYIEKANHTGIIYSDKYVDINK